MKNIFLVSVFVLLFVLSFSSLVLSVAPNGANIVAGTNQTAPADDPTGNEAYAGNLTELTITGYSTTQTWQGYFGNVTGTIQLADSNNSVMYNWSLANPSGEVYASTSDSIAWSSIACYNVVTDTLGLEAAYTIGANEADGLNETFATQNHDEFYTNNVHFTADDCYSVQLYDSTGASTDGSFEEVVLTDGSNAVFTSLLEDASANGFDQNDHDFEMLVLEDGHGEDTSTTTYYFYVELE